VSGCRKCDHGAFISLTALMVWLIAWFVSLCNIGVVPEKAELVFGMRSTTAQLLCSRGGPDVELERNSSQYHCMWSEKYTYLWPVKGNFYCTIQDVYSISTTGTIRVNKQLPLLFL